MVMDTVIPNDAAAANTNRPDILAWFNWAERLTTGLGTQSEWQMRDENNFDAVLLSLVASLHTKQGADASDIQHELKKTGVPLPEKLVVNSASAVAIETITLFMLERLATQDDERAFFIADTLRDVSNSNVFVNQLQLLQMNLIAGNPDLENRNLQPFGDEAAVRLAASTQRSVKADSFADDVYRSSVRLQHSFFTARAPALNAA